METATWEHHCAVALQERCTRLPDGLADVMAETLRESHPHLSPWQAARRFFELAEGD